MLAAAETTRWHAYVALSLLVGQHRSATTESVYRHEIRPALTQGAEVMDKIFG